MIRPLSKNALRALIDVAEKPVPSQEINPGVCRKLVAMNLAIYVMLPTPYKTRKGDISHLTATGAGREHVDAWREGERKAQIEASRVYASLVRDIRDGKTLARDRSKDN